jgi:signal transduction histidine kinase
MAGLVASGSRAPRLASAALSPAPAYPLRGAAALGVLAAIPAFHALFGGGSGHPALDAARERLTGGAVLVAGLLLAVREILAHREGAAARRLLQTTRARLEAAEERCAQLLELAGSPAERTTGCLGDLVRSVVTQREAELRRQGLSLRVDVPVGLPAAAMDGRALQQLLLGLIDDAAAALEALESPGIVEVAARRAGDHLVLTVADRVAALATAGAAGGGRVRRELGLYVAREVALRHGGRVRGRSRPDGVEIEIRLPVRAERVSVQRGAAD